MNSKKTKSPLKKLLLAVATTFLAGCTSTDSVRLPRDARAAPGVHSHRIVNDIRPDIAREVSEDSNLSDYLTIAALNNPGLEASFYQWKSALERIPQVKALPDPRFNYGYFIREVETRVGPQNQKLGISQAFPWFGKLRLRGEKAGNAARAAQHQYEAAKLKLFYDVKDAYYELFYLSQAIAIAEENIDLLKRLEKVAQAKFRSGSDVTGVLKAQVELGKLEDRLQSLNDLRGPVLARFNAALNRPISALMPWPRRFDVKDMSLADNELSATLEAYNPELKVLAERISEEETGVQLAKTDFWPDFTLGIDYIDTGASTMSGVSDGGKDPLVVMGSMSLPLWWGKYRAGLREAETRLAAARKTLAEKENLLSAELQLTLYKFRDAQRKASLFRDTLTPLAKNSLDVAEQSYKAGKVDFLELIDAQRLLLEFQLSYQRAVADREQQLAHVETLIGKEVTLIKKGLRTTEGTQ